MPKCTPMIADTFSDKQSERNRESSSLRSDILTSRISRRKLTGIKRAHRRVGAHSWNVYPEGRLARFQRVDPPGVRAQYMAAWGLGASNGVYDVF